MRRIPKGAKALIAIPLSVLLLVGCSSNQGEVHQDAKTWSQANSEYQAEAAMLTLPNGLALPVQIPRPRERNGSPNVFQDGVGRGAADSLWYCGWESAWLTDLAAARQRAKTDLATMKTLVQLSKYTESTTPGDRHIYSDAWARADLGDPALVQQDFTANCDISLLGHK